MPAETPGVSIKLLDKEYAVACADDERDELIEAARFLDRRMREVREGGRVLGTERIAVMAALNLAHELLQDRRQHSDYTVGVERIASKLERALQGDIAGQSG